MMGFWNISIPLGIAVGVAVGGYVAHHWGWRHAFGLVALPGAIVAILFFVKDYKTVELTKTVETGKVKMSKKDIFHQFVRVPSLVLTYIGFIGCIFSNNALITWLSNYFHRVDGIPLAQAGLKTARS